MKKLLLLSLVVHTTLLPLTAYNITVSNQTDGRVFVNLLKTAPGYANPDPAGYVEAHGTRTWSSGADAWVTLAFTYPDRKTGQVTAKRCQNKFRIFWDGDRYNWDDDYRPGYCD